MPDSKIYKGDLSSSSSPSAIEKEVIVHTNDGFMMISFEWNGVNIGFRGYYDQTTEGRLMSIQDKVSDEFILKGVDGFVHNSPKYHAGCLDKLEAVFFHVPLTSRTISQTYSSSSY